MVFSAPEITTVSKPKRNPARAEVSDQKKMRPFIGLRGGAYHRTARSAVTPCSTSRVRTKLNLLPADNFFRASHVCRRPSKSRWYIPSSADCRPPGQSGIRRRSTEPFPCPTPELAPRYRARSHPCQGESHLEDDLSRTRSLRAHPREGTCRLGPFFSLSRRHRSRELARARRQLS